MASSGANDSYDFCEFCRINHDHGRKHVYSKRHKDRIQSALRRFCKKIKEAKSEIKKPTVSNNTSLLEVNFWCYMCAQEIQKHGKDFSNKDIILNFKGFIVHLLSADHLKNVKQFLWEHKLDKNEKDKYIFTEDHWIKYQQSIKSVVTEFKNNKKKIFQEKVMKMVNVEEKRQQLLQPEKTDFHGNSDMIAFTSVCNSRSQITASYPLYQHSSSDYYSIQGKPSTNTLPAATSASVLPHSVPSSPKPDSGQIIPTSSQSTPVLPWLQTSMTTNTVGISVNEKTKESQMCSHVKTVSIKSSGGLTVIQRQGNSKDGNIHTGALPPWLQDDEEKVPVIGPTEEDFLKHLERERKRKLNPNRVGANFDHKIPTNDEWLPSFGRVWNQGRRWQSR
ncbi:centrosomal AT-AC splicing factor-like [Saccoglossus kowalevskii]|uniref:Coiled-coil domain-containing protein 84-like n=1 Tax=Saccoglossus kowalevskii TaxID=10224 RepID=A0ABM0LUE2_SACKO|nr:PREDICTED: coiled-coil domain-containing protein 84-like [Saccoglossus kowalevskii]